MEIGYLLIFIGMILVFIGLIYPTRYEQYGKEPYEGYERKYEMREYDRYKMKYTQEEYDQTEKRESRVKAGGIIMIGPIPIIFGDAKLTFYLAILAVVLMIFGFLFMIL